MKVIYTIIFFSFFSLFANAGDTKRNGGDVVICGKIPNQTFELLDLVEGRLAYGFAPRNISAVSTFEVVKNLLNSIEKWNPTRARLYSDFLSLWNQESRLIGDGSFTNYPDEGGVLIPAGCEIQQAIIQLRTPDFTGARYLVNEKLWAQLDPYNQGALIIHEFIYRELTSDNRLIQDSSSVRYFNSFLFSTETQGLTFSGYIKILQKSGLKYADANGYQIALNSGDELVTTTRDYPVDFYDTNHVRSATLGRKLKIENVYKTEISCIPFQNQPEEIFITFSANSKQASIFSSCLMYLPLDQMDKMGSAAVDTIEMDSPNRIQSAILRHFEKLDIVNRKAVYLTDREVVLSKAGETKLTFWPDGSLQMIKKWQTDEDKKSSTLQTNGAAISLFDLHLDRICFSNFSPGTTRCGEYAWHDEN